MESEVLPIHANRWGWRAETFIMNANVAQSNPGVHEDEDVEGKDQMINPGSTSARPDLERDSTFRVPKAVLVEDRDDEA